MENVIIVSKTQMRNGYCVGGIIEDTGQLIRIHGARGQNLGLDAPYEIGDVWLMDVERAWNVRPAPHTEDMQTIAFDKISNIGFSGIINYVRNHVHELNVARGPIQNAFDGALHFDGNKNYVNRNHVPNYSTQFWIPDQPLYRVESYGKFYYRYNNVRIKFVGLQETVAVIPAGSIVRISLANWWDGDGSGEDRCYLQLSGWYL